MIENKKLTWQYLPGSGPFVRNYLDSFQNILYTIDVHIIGQWILEGESLKRSALQLAKNIVSILGILKSQKANHDDWLPPYSWKFTEGRIVPRSLYH